MRKTISFIAAFGILFLFFIQMAGTLIESMYILDLMNTTLDEKALCALFFFAPVLLLLFRRQVPTLLVWGMFGLLFVSRGAAPYLATSGRLLASGVGTGSALILFTLLLTARPKEPSQPLSGRWISAGLALAVSLSVLLRALGYSLDISLTPANGWIGWGLGLLLAALLTQLDRRAQPAQPAQPARQGQQSSLTGAVVGIFFILTLIYFAFSSPAVLARWTQANYVAIVITVSALSAGWAWLAVRQPRVLQKLGTRGLALWNAAFTLGLVATILAQRVAFPPTPDSAPVIVGAASIYQHIPLALMLLLFPVLFLDLRVFVNRIQRQNPSPHQLVPGLLLGGAALLVLLFTNIFTNVWGYIPPISPLFRNLFWLPFLISAGAITLLIGLRSTDEAGFVETPIHTRWAAFLAFIFLGSAGGALHTALPPSVTANPSSLIVMTYNIQAGNDGAAEPAYERQLALIRKVSPDILALQESDTARIGLNNNDYVRYLASSLGYYSYYGPTTVTGTFGTAILSKYPLVNPAVVFSYSDLDEIGTTEAQVELAGRTLTLYDVHPDGSDTAKMAFARALLARAQGQPNGIALGDFNLKQGDPAYQAIAAVYSEAWASAHPSEVSPHIDHIFVSSSLSVRSPTYLLPPASASDHPAHWAEIVLEK